MNCTRSFFLKLRFFLAIFLSIILIVVDCKIGLFTKIRSYLDTSIGTFCSFVSKPSQILKDTLKNFSSNSLLQEENKKLRYELYLKNSAVLLLNKYKKENEYLRKLLGAAVLHNEKHVMLSRVIFTTSIPYSDQVIINKGNIDGVYKNQPVIADKGIVGKVISVNNNTSRVLLSCDSSSGIAVKSLRNNVHAMAIGKGCDKEFQLQYLIKNDIDINQNIHVGDIMVTSNFDNYFPEGYPVGTVSSIKIDNRVLRAYIQLHPVTNFRNLDYLLLLCRTNNSSESNNGDIYQTKL
ncbi:rod shape-determining protein MreC [Pantoea sp. SoEX]|uniref:rod shape-determining protein MreC n=1 Tax=Pantoea sp. SoEX TaxID=2576763 RepID=UPI001424FACB|nr:rod shape-determining protein MreC [Pantoea sp. SoEX]MXP51338.1 rod shape-determining protein MreC [Pantoea sp. SoEX]